MDTQNTKGVTSVLPAFWGLGILVLLGIWGLDRDYSTAGDRNPKIELNVTKPKPSHIALKNHKYCIITQGTAPFEHMENGARICVGNSTTR
uniref:SFRICE_038114 n=1 Tax=Spodoptera frugiperda TaxID=7108 RepID=A0A2H1WN32_SPOFR